MAIQRKKILPLAFLALATASLVGCSGSSTSTPTNNIPTDFLNKPGVWKLDMDANLDITINFSGVTSTTETDLSLLDVMSVDASGAQVISKTCDELPAETAQMIDPNESPFTDAGGSQICPGETSTFTQLSDNTYRITYSCSNGNGATMIFTHLTSTPGFDFGSLSLTSSQHADLNASTGVCGNFENSSITQTATPQPNSFGITNSSSSENSFSVMAPYDGNYLLMSFNFYDNIQVATYTATNPGLASQADEVGVELLSTVYGGTPDNPGGSYATGGSVTITAISATGATGTFVLTTEQGDSLSGSFSFDIQ